MNKALTFKTIFESFVAMVDFLRKYPKEVDVAILIIGYIIGINLFLFLKMAGLDELGLTLTGENERPKNYVMPSVVGLFIGLAFYFWEYKVYPSISKTAPRGLRFIYRFCGATLIITVVFLTLFTLMNMVLEGISVKESWVATVGFLYSGLFLSIYIFLMLLSITLHFFREIGNRYGHGILVNYLLGKYHEPVEENRIFLFIDLNHSTKIAEKLGHTKYSRLLNRCFSDLSSLLPKYDAEIYQYVGDEAVVTWNINTLKNHAYPAYLFFAYDALLQKNQSMYLEKFGLFPQFKASINSGPVIVTELGAHRKALAYHGDVLNTASRVLELCSQFKKKLLMTSSLIDPFKNESRLSIKFVSDLVLRGKNDKTAVYEVVLHQADP